MHETMWNSLNCQKLPLSNKLTFVAALRRHISERSFHRLQNLTSPSSLPFSRSHRYDITCVTSHHIRIKSRSWEPLISWRISSLQSVPSRIRAPFPAALVSPETSNIINFIFTSSSILYLCSSCFSGTGFQFVKFVGCSLKWRIVATSVLVG